MKCALKPFTLLRAVLDVLEGLLKHVSVYLMGLKGPLHDMRCEVSPEPAPLGARNSAIRCFRLRVSLSETEGPKNEKPRRKAGLCDTVHDRAFGSKAGEAIRTPDIHVGDVTMGNWVCLKSLYFIGMSIKSTIHCSYRNGANNPQDYHPVDACVVLAQHHEGGLF